MARPTEVVRRMKKIDQKRMLVVTARDKFETGGTDTYMNHLMYVGQEMGLDPILVKAHKSTETFTRQARHMPFPYQNMSVAHIGEWARAGNHVFVCTVNSKRTSDMRSKIFKHVLSTNETAHLVVHCPNHIKDFTGTKSMIPLYRMRGKVVAIGKGVHALCGNSGFYIPHPYTQFPVSIQPRRSVAVCTSLVMECKHIDMILDANRKLRDSQKIDLTGRVDRMYVFRRLTDYPEINDYKPFVEHSGFGSGVKICANYQLCINLTTVKFDGGRTEYATMEAWDAGAVPVVHRDWVTNKADTDMVPFDGQNLEKANCFAVGTADELAGIVGDTYERMLSGSLDIHKTLVNNGRRLLETRRPAVIRSYFDELIANPRQEG